MILELVIQLTLHVRILLNSQNLKTIITYLILVGPCQPLNPCNNGGTCASTDGIVLRGLKTFYFIIIKLILLGTTFKCTCATGKINYKLILTKTIQENSN